MKCKSIMIAVVCLWLLPGIAGAEADLRLETLKTEYEKNPTRAAVVREYGVALARSDRMEEALQVFRDAKAATGSDMGLLYDYLVVLTWKGEPGEAISLFEKRRDKFRAGTPDYVMAAVAGAYYKLGKYVQAKDLYRALSRTMPRARLWEAESLMRLGELKAAAGLYERLLREDPQDAEIYLSRASVLIKTGNTADAAADVAKALEVLGQNPLGQEKILDVRAEMATQFIQADYFSEAIAVLRPAIDNATATPRMQANYILALRLNQEYGRAVTAATTLWKDYKNVPIFGLQALADCHLRMGRPKPALMLYRLILDRDAAQSDARLSLAYAYMLEGQTSSALGEYEKVLTVRPQIADTVAGDAEALLSLGRYQAARQLYEKLFLQFPERSEYRKKWAAALLAAGMPREANEQYQLLARMSGTELAGKTGAAMTAMTVGDYAAARPLVEELQEKFPRSPQTGQAGQKLDRQPRGEVEAVYQEQQDYKQKSVRTMGLSGAVRTQDNVTLLAAVSEKKLKDQMDTARLKAFSAGIRYSMMNFDATLWVDQYQIPARRTGYRLDSNAYFGDQSWLNLQVSRTPVEAVAAVNRTGGPLMAQNYNLEWYRKLGKKDLVSLSTGWSRYEDGNRTRSYGVNWEHTLSRNDLRQASWIAYYTRLGYRYQTINGEGTLYESPTVREAYGWALRQRLNLDKSYWEGTLYLEWGRDRPEPIDFSPHFRLEYGYRFSPDQLLVLGVEYGLRTGYSTNQGGNLGFGFRHYDMTYHSSW